ncbi:HAD-IIB family hydrolase [Sphingomonas baiyangensis]|uniref:sucrose-phosphate synthase n=1 Tax=Sphingomonas baiyangensis TaxID=2572576 RepID=A0A4U1L390_9SPHN|nr:HAD-IIB family hydrolase [Sphingomonas baiyangensis]TKD51132.1 HAD-IIB family hydrolase [Sphingomonas baiyangensis]
MRIMSLALGGCLKAPPVAFGLTEDTGGHITYILGAARALAARADVRSVEIVTRLIDDTTLGTAYAQPTEHVAEGVTIRRIDSGNRAYLSKEANAADRPAFTAALIAHLERCAERPDVLHAHFADAAEVAMAVRARFGIPFIFTGHSMAIDKQAAMAAPCPGIAARIALETRAVCEADAIIASSRDEAERQLMGYAGADAARIHCVPPGANLDTEGDASGSEARALLAPFLRDLDRPALLAIARPVAKKNLVGLVDLYAGDPWLRDHANLVIVAGLRDAPDSGETEQRGVIAGLLDRLDRHDLYGRMALPKRHDQHHIAALYAYARQTGGVFANPAWTEPYGLTLTEAAFHGLPVVATAHGGPGDIVAAMGHGLLADPRDPPAFAAAIRALISDRARWQAASAAGRRGARQRDWAGYAERFVGIARGLRDAPIAHVRPARLLLADIDNTLTGCRAGAADLCALLAERREIGFGIATGRSLQEAQRLLGEWDYPDPMVMVTSVGSEIYWRAGGRLIADADYAAMLAGAWDADAIEAVAATVPGLVPQPAVDQRRFKRSWFADAAAAERLRMRLAAARIDARVVHSHATLLDVLPARAGKGAAMRWVAERLGLPLDRVDAAGDSGNDLDMLECCPNAIIVANHSHELTGLARRRGIHVATRPSAGGIADAMRMRIAAPAAGAAR